jgi:hypothetical protein
MRPADPPVALRFAPLPEDGGVLDRSTGLVWERTPGRSSLTWDEATGGAGAGWRLPTIGELSSLEAALTADHPFEGSDPRGVFWSVSESPFARHGQVRGLCVEGGGRFVMVLLERTSRARRWRVRALQTGVGGPTTAPTS